MSSLMPLRRRIKTVKATQKLTHAMRLVAIASHSKQKNSYGCAQLHKKTTGKLLSELIKAHPHWYSPILTPSDSTNTSPLVIIISPIRGMCGSFRNNLIRYAADKLNFEYYQSPTFITIGSRAQQIAKKSLGQKPGKKLDITTHFDELSIALAPNVARSISNIILKQQNHFSQITCLGSIFVNLFRQKPKLQTIIPVPTIENETSKKDLIHHEYHWEQDKDQILNNIAQNYVYITILQALYESLFAEDAARFVAMDMATTNAEKHIETMLLEYNKIRQTSITQEVTELSSAL